MRKFAVAKGFEDKGVILPTRSTTGSAGYDIRVLNGATILPNEKIIFDTGVKAYMEDDEVLMIYIRSSAGIKRGLSLTNGTGIIDSSYVDNPQNDGHIMLAIVNNSSVPVVIENNERVAQGVFVKYLTTDDDNVIAKRKGGIGSTSNNEKEYN